MDVEYQNVESEALKETRRYWRLRNLSHYHLITPQRTDISPDGIFQFADPRVHVHVHTLHMLLRHGDSVAAAGRVSPQREETVWREGGGTQIASEDILSQRRELSSEIPRYICSANIYICCTTITTAWNLFASSLKSALVPNIRGFFSPHNCIHSPTDKNLAFSVSMRLFVCIHASEFFSD